MKYTCREYEVWTSETLYISKIHEQIQQLLNRKNNNNNSDNDNTQVSSFHNHIKQ